ncbi:MAG: HD domain-containing protein [Rickettsiales bacterium]|jgi:hypothetical protein|nr:HD domain-containing protein [Rickettsiales bacterium]
MRNAEKLLDEALAECIASGGTDGWAVHSRKAAQFARAVASACGMDAEFAYNATLLHDAGRSYPEANAPASVFMHGPCGYRFLESRGALEYARFAITHFISSKAIKKGDWAGLSPADEELCIRVSASAPFDDYDMLVQLADNTALKEGFVFIEQRMIDSMFRYGQMPGDMARFLYLCRLKAKFDAKCGRNVYLILPDFVQEAAAMKYDYMSK